MNDSKWSKAPSWNYAIGHPNHLFLLIFDLWFFIKWEITILKRMDNCVFSGTWLNMETIFHKYLQTHHSPLHACTNPIPLCTYWKLRKDKQGHGMKDQHIETSTCGFFKDTSEKWSHNIHTWWVIVSHLGPLYTWAWTQAWTC